MEKILTVDIDKSDEVVNFDEDSKKKVLLIVGVNGVGKTTSIGKIANLYKKKARKSYLLLQILSEQELLSNLKYGQIVLVVIFVLERICKIQHQLYMMQLKSLKVEIMIY